MGCGCGGSTASTKKATRRSAKTPQAPRPSGGFTPSSAKPFTGPRRPAKP